MKNKRLTIHEIAALAGVSISAVSIALNDRPGISGETRDRILEIVKKHNYIPNPNSRRLLFNRSDNIAVLFDAGISTLANMFYSEINNAILPECAEYGYNLIYASYTVENGAAKLPRIIAMHDAAGIIFLGDPHESVVSLVRDSKIPFVIGDTHQLSGDIPSVYVDYELSAYAAVKYLIECGHSAVGFFGSSTQAYNRSVFSGYRRALDEFGIAYNPRWHTVADNNDADAGAKAEIMTRTWGALPSAIFFSGDIIAIGAIRYLRENGVQIPRDISAVSIDNILLSDYITPRLTSVDVDKVQIAKSCFQILRECIEQQTPEGRNIKVRSDHLIIRDSVRCLV